MVSTFLLCSSLCSAKLGHLHSQQQMNKTIVYQTNKSFLYNCLHFLKQQVVYNQNFPSILLPNFQFFIHVYVFDAKKKKKKEKKNIFHLFTLSTTFILSKLF